MSNAKQRASRKRVLKAQGEREGKVALRALVNTGVVTEDAARHAKMKVQVNPGKEK